MLDSFVTTIKCVFIYLTTILQQAALGKSLSCF